MNHYSYPFDFEDTNYEDERTIKTNQRVLGHWFIANFSSFKDSDYRKFVAESGRQHICSLGIRESLKLALQCWYDETLARVA